jgi:hypothetical protein
VHLESLILFRTVQMLPTGGDWVKGGRSYLQLSGAAILSRHGVWTVQTGLRGPWLRALGCKAGAEEALMGLCFLVHFQIWARKMYRVVLKRKAVIIVSVCEALV